MGKLVIAGAVGYFAGKTVTGAVLIGLSTYVGLRVTEAIIINKQLNQ